jgi:hypothetical protein
MGHELAQVADLLNGVRNDPRERRADAPREHVRRQDVSTVLDRFETYCRALPSSVTRAMNDFPKSWRTGSRRSSKAASRHRHRPARGGRARDGCLLRERRSGHDVRLQGAAPPVSARLGVAQRVRSLPLSFAERSDGRTHVVTTGPIRGSIFARCFPRRATRRGADSRLVPRPPNSREDDERAAADGRPYRIWIYESTERADAVRALS